MSPEMNLEALEEQVKKLAWEELEIEKKLERMRGVVKDLQNSVACFMRAVHEDLAKLKQHTHGPTGSLLIPLEVWLGGGMMIGDGREEPPSGKPWF